MTGRPIHRREFLTGSAGLAGAFALGIGGRGLLGSPVLRSSDANRLIKAATSVKPAGSDIGAIKHVVFLMHENRSFDHYFGTLNGVAGFDDTNNSAAFSQNWPGNSSPLQPFHLDTTTGIAECTNDLNHSWQAEHACWDSGAMDAFVATHTDSAYGEGPDYGTLTMGYYEEADLPFYYALAQAFTICDNYFCSVLGPTHPNRLMQMTGTIDPAGAGGGPVLVTNSQNDLEFTCNWLTMPEVLTNAGVSWRVYNPYGPNYTPGGLIAMEVCKNVLMYFENYQDTSSELYQNAFGAYGITVPASNAGLTGVSSSLTKPPDTKPPAGSVTFASDVKNGTLPQVSWIVPPDGYDEHPPAPAALGEWYSAQVIKTLMSNTDIWESTVLFIMYDENDGWFDHVPPPTAPSGTSGEYVTADTSSYNGGQDATFAQGTPIGLGVRVPMIVVSPFSQGGYVCSDVFDHTSQLALLAELFSGVDGTVGGNVSTWRQGTVGNLTSALPTGPTLTSKGKLIWPKKPVLPKTSDDIKDAPITSPDQCAPDDLVEVNSPNGSDPTQRPTVTVSNCTTVAGSTTVSLPKGSFTFSFDGVYTGMSVTGSGIPNGTTVTDVKSTKLTLSQAATASGTVTLSFPQPYTPYTIPNPNNFPPAQYGPGLTPTPS